MLFYTKIVCLPFGIPYNYIYTDRQNESRIRHFEFCYKCYMHLTACRLAFTQFRAIQPAPFAFASTTDAVRAPTSNKCLRYLRYIRLKAPNWKKGIAVLHPPPMFWVQCDSGGFQAVEPFPCLQCRSLDVFV